MDYTIQDIQEKFSVVSEDMEHYVRKNKIKVGKDGAISGKVHQTLLDFYSADNDVVNGNPVYVLNGHKIEVKTKPFFESDNQRVSIFQDDAIKFLKKLPASAVCPSPSSSIPLAQS